MKSSKILFSILSSFFILFYGNSTAQGTTNTDYINLIDRYVEYWNTGIFENIEEVLHPEFQLRMTPNYEPEEGIETFKETIEKWRVAYPDFKVEILEIIFEEDKAAGLWRITGTHTGPGWIPPTNKKIDVPGMSFFHFKDGKLLDEWIAGNNGYWLQQLGYTIQPPTEE